MRNKWRTVCALITGLSLLLGSTSLASGTVGAGAQMPGTGAVEQAEASGEQKEKAGGQEESDKEQEDPSREQKKTDEEQEAPEKTLENAVSGVAAPSLKELLENGEDTGTALTDETKKKKAEGAERDFPLSGVFYGRQTMEEILNLCDRGLDLEEFFRYTIWGFVTREQLQALSENGHDLDDVYEAVEKGDSDGPKDIADIVEAYALVPRALSFGDTRVVGFHGRLSADLGSIPAFGSDRHGTMSKIHLSGETAFCARFGAPLRAGMVYSSVPLSAIGVDAGKERLIRGLLAQYAEAQATYNGPVNYILIQASIWLVLNNAWTGNGDEMAADIAPLFSKTPDCPSAAFAASYFRSIVEWLNAPGHEAQIEAIGLEGWSFGPNQYLLTATGEGGSLEESGPYAHIEIQKTDRDTGCKIADDTEFTIYEWNGSGYEPSAVSVSREGDTYISDDLFFTDKNQGKFYVEESLAPHRGGVTGYYGDFEGGAKRRHEFQVKESMKGEVISITNGGSSFQNTRTTGSIRMFKTDIEAASYISGEMSHGTATLDGALYDLFAGEDVVHPDGVTGVVHKKDSLVASETIADGTCVFENLYLGSYYIRERQKGQTLPDGKKLSYARGYLLDEEVYNVHLPYEGETTADVHREVHSSKEQVIKAKAVFEKVESAAGQGNIRYLEGAGFTVYRIDRLGRREAFLQNPDGTYDEKSIQAAYLVEDYGQDTPKYDFRGEEGAIATLYLGDSSAREDTKGYWQSGKADLDAGRLLPLGNHRYRVAELFSDADGRVTTPYLPYGQYLVVETTVPEDHFMAPPFVLTFRQGKSDRILTTGITEETSYGKNILRSSGDSTAFWEAVYFSGVIDNEAVEQLLKLYKRDADTGKTVLLADAQFRLAKISKETGEKTYITHTTYYPETVNQDIFCTNEKGYLQLPELLAAGLYQIEEVEGPPGFFNDVPGGYVRFKVTTDREYVSFSGNGPDGSILEGDEGKRDVLLIIEWYDNQETRGLLTIRKKGEVLTGYKNVSLLQDIRQLFGMHTKKQFVYEELPLAGAEYTIRAAEDIVTQDRQTDRDGKRTLWLQKGETAAVVTTGEDGQVDRIKTSTKLYPDGHPVVCVVHDGELGSVKAYLPLGSYEVAETKAPYGYTRSKEIQKVTFTWEHQFQEFVFNHAPIEKGDGWDYNPKDGALTVTNRRVKAIFKNTSRKPGVGVFKRAREKNAPIGEVSFGLYTIDPIYTPEGVKIAEAGELLSACVTGGDGRGVFDVDVPIRDEHYGEEEGTNSGEYEIRELEAPRGVILDATPIPLHFTYVDDETEYVVLAKEQQNKTSEAYVSKQDAANEEELKGASLMIMERWSGQTVETWVSEGIKREIRGLAVNNGVEDNSYMYILRETAAPQGYYIASEILFKLVEEETEDGETKNQVYVYEPQENSWKRASQNTVVMKDAAEPAVPDIPKTPKTPESPHQPETPREEPSAPEPAVTPQTGDRADIRFWMILLLASAAMGRILYGAYRREE